MKRVTKAIKNETKEQKGGFLSVALCTLGATLLGNVLSGKEIIRDDSEIEERKWMSRAVYGNKFNF